MRVEQGHSRVEEAGNEQAHGGGVAKLDWENGPDPVHRTNLNPTYRKPVPDYSDLHHLFSWHRSNWG